MGKALKSSFGVAMQATRRDNFYGKEGFSLCNTAALKLIVSLTGNCNLFYRIVPLSQYYCFTCFASIEIGKAKSAI